VRECKTHDRTLRRGKFQCPSQVQHESLRERGALLEHSLPHPALKRLAENSREIRPREAPQDLFLKQRELRSRVEYVIGLVISILSKTPTYLLKLLLVRSTEVNIIEQAAYNSRTRLITPVLHSIEMMNRYMLQE
jgi:hypothetical protein